MASTDDTARIISESAHVARTAHVCTECEAGILPGDRYVRTAFKADGRVYAYRTHAEVCAEPLI